MTDRLTEKIRAENAAWWTAHPKFAESVHDAPTNSLARSVVHWHHNVESSRRYEQPKDVEANEHFLRRYAVFATQAWLKEAQAELDATHDVEWSRKLDLEVLVRQLQRALDDFEWNDKNRKETP